MKYLKTLYRSPLISGLTLLLLVLVVFLFLYTLSDYYISNREYRAARDQYEGVLTIDTDSLPMDSMKSAFDYFLHTDPTNPAETYAQIDYEDFHQPDIAEEALTALKNLPYVSRLEQRYMTAGVSPDYMRPDADKSWYAYHGRCILTAEIKAIEPAFGISALLMMNEALAEEGMLALTLTDCEMLAGDPDWLRGFEEQQLVLLPARDECKGEYHRITTFDYSTRQAFLTLDPDFFLSDVEKLVVGHRYVFVLRNNFADGHGGQYSGADMGPAHMFYLGDDFRKGWWPYYVDITNLKDGWLDTDDFAPLRELIQVTNDDVHTFDVIYGDDMSAIRRVADGRIICDEGRFLTPADAGQPVCVMNTDLMGSFGLKVGDSITLDLGNYLCEQYASLGAVASTKGRHATDFTRQVFTIVGSWRDLNEGKHTPRDRYWCYSISSIFVPASFLPECVNKDTYAPKAGEVSFVIGNAEKITAFVEDSLPRVEAMGLSCQFSDGGWLRFAIELIQAKNISLLRLLLFLGAVLLALVLTVWLFIGRRKREYGILRALGMDNRKAGTYLLFPFLLLGLVSTLAGLIAAWMVTTQRIALETAHAPAPIVVYVLGAMGFFVLLAVVAILGLFLICRKSILELTQEKQK